MAAIIKPAFSLLFDGIFSCDLKTLHENLKGVKKYYTTIDPRTWPLIEELIPADLMDQHGTNVLPWGVAYERELVNSLCDTNGRGRGTLYADPGKSGSPRLKWELIVFYRYPYNFDRNGQLRERIGMSQSDLKLWMDSINGKEWIAAMGETFTKESTDSSTKSGTASRTESSTKGDSDSIEKDTNVSNCAASTTYDRIMEVLGRQKQMHSEEVPTQEEIQKLKEQLQHETQRANTAQLAVKGLRDALETGKVDAQNHINRLNTELQQKDTWSHDQAEAAKAKLAEKDKELVTAQEKLKTANKQMEDVWKTLSEMQEDYSVRRGKRKRS